MTMAAYEPQAHPTGAAGITVDTRDCVLFDRVPTPVFVLDMIDRHEPNVFRCSFANRAFHTLVGDADSRMSADEVEVQSA